MAPPPSLVPPKLELDGVLVIWIVGDMVLMVTSVVLALAACWIWHIRYREEEKQQLLDPAPNSRSEVAAETALVNAAAPVRVHQHTIPLGQLHGHSRFMLDLEAADASATDTEVPSRGAGSEQSSPVDEYRSTISSVRSPRAACDSVTNMATNGPGAATSPPIVLLHKLSSHLAQSLATVQLARPPGLVRQETPHNALRCIPLDGRIRSISFGSIDSPSAPSSTGTSGSLASLDLPAHTLHEVGRHDAPVGRTPVGNLWEDSRPHRSSSPSASVSVISVGLARLPDRPSEAKRTQDEPQVPDLALALAPDMAPRKDELKAPNMAPIVAPTMAPRLLHGAPFLVLQVRRPEGFQLWGMPEGFSEGFLRTRAHLHVAPCTLRLSPKGEALQLI
jgi:hypothetical protein